MTRIEERFVWAQVCDCVAQAAANIAEDPRVSNIDGATALRGFAEVVREAALRFFDEERGTVQ